MSISNHVKRVTIIAIIGLLLVGSFGMIFNIHPSALGSGENWLSGWSYRKSHVIDGTGTSAGTNYQVAINVYYLNYLSLGSVTTKAPIPTGLSDFPAATYDNKIYTFGGYGTGSGDVKNLVYCYDPSTDAWTQKTSMPTARWGPIAVEFDGLIYVFGGTASVNQVYDPTSDTWSTKSGLPSGFDQGLMGVRYGSTIQLFYKNLHYAYDPATDTYTSKANVPAPLTWGTCAYVNVGGEDRIYIIGGYSYSSGGGTNTVYYYRPAYDDWITASTTAPYAAYGTTRDNPVIGGKIYYGYGNSAGSSFFYSSMYAYDPVANTWTQLTSGAYPRDGMACGVVNGKLYVIGGRGSEGSPVGLPYNECFDPTAVNPIVDNGSTLTANMKCKMDFGDIRFTASDGVTPLSYWLQSYTTGVVATFWVKIADNLSGASATIYMYYGNPSAATTSNGAAVWTLFDDFEGATPLSNYAADIGSISSFTIATLGSNHVLSYIGPVAWFLLSRITPTFQNMRMIATMMPVRDSGNYYTGISFRETAYNNWYFSWLAGPSGSLYAGSPDGTRNDWIRRVGGTDAYIAGGPTTDLRNTWANMEVDMAGSSCKTYVNGVKKADATDTTITSAGKIGFMGLYASYWDNLCVGSYVNPEPAHGIWGAEETNAYTLTVSTVGSGHVDLDVAGPYHYGDVVHLTAVPAAGWRFDHWSGDVGGSVSPAPLTITGDMAVTAYFVFPQLYVDPTSIQKGPGDTYTTFQTSVLVNKISDLRGFDIKLTWDNNLIALVTVDYTTTLNNMWGTGNWYLAYEATGAGYYELAAVSTSTGFTGTTPTPLATLTYIVKAAVGQTSIHFALVKLSDSQAQPIQAEVTDGTYTVTGPQYQPVLQMTPGAVTCRKYHEYFTVQVNVTNAVTMDGFSFTIYYTPTMMSYVSVSWGELGSGTITNVDPVNGILEGHVAGTAISGNRWLLNVTFQDTATMIWKQGQVNELDGQIWFHYAQLSFSGIQQLTYQEGGLGEISVNNVAFKFIPIQGDIDGDGIVDILDMRAIAAYFDVKQGDPLWSAASAYDLNNNGVIDIYDLVLVGANFS